MRLCIENCYQKGRSDQQSYVTKVERVPDGIQPRSDQPFAQGYRQTRQQRRITYQQVIQLLESQKRNQRRELDQLLDVKESEIDKLRDRVSQLEDNFDIALSELESKEGFQTDTR